MRPPEALDSRREFLSFRLGNEEYAIGILQVQEIRAYETATRIAGAPAYVKGVINLRGSIVPIVDLRVKFAMPAAGDNVAPVVIILNIGRRVIGVRVDSVSDVLALSSEDIRPAPELGGAVDATFITGIATVDDRLLVVVDIARLLTEGEVDALPEAA